nr:hypothetical protein Iba_chr01bCG2480 [Ipomoea batatas]
MANSEKKQVQEDTKTGETEELSEDIESEEDDFPIFSNHLPNTSPEPEVLQTNPTELDPHEVHQDEIIQVDPTVDERVQRKMILVKSSKSSSPHDSDDKHDGGVASTNKPHDKDDDSPKTVMHPKIIQPPLWSLVFSLIVPHTLADIYDHSLVRNAYYALGTLILRGRNSKCAAMSSSGMRILTVARIDFSESLSRTTLRSRSIDDVFRISITSVFYIKTLTKLRRRIY